MENMRWILLLIGALLVIGIYVAGRLQSREPTSRRRRHAAARSGRTNAHDFTDVEADVVEPLLVGEGDDRQDEVVTSIERQAPAAVDDTVFSLFVIAPASVPFRGPVLLGALEAANLEFGDMHIFHRTEQIDGQEKVLFSLANIREPGTFDLSAMEEFTTEGLALFIQVPAVVEAGRAFDAMVESARQLAESLDGQVCDARRSALTQQTIRHMREQVVNCQLQQRVARTAS